MANEITEWKIECEPSDEDVAKASAELDLAMIEMIYASMRRDFEQRYGVVRKDESAAIAQTQDGDNQ